MSAMEEITVGDDHQLRQQEIDYVSGDMSINETAFRQLMTDLVFVDYFNVFLSLPVFAERIIYLRAQDRFELNPPVNSPDLIPDKSRMLSWLYSHRMPLFVRSELFAEYKLCCRLLEHANSGAAPLRIQQQQPPPTKTIRDSPRQTSGGAMNSDTRSRSTKPTASGIGTRMLAAIGGVARMRNFRHYLADGPGRKLYDFWMDAERFFRIPVKDERSRWLKYREIQIAFCELKTSASKKTQQQDHDFDADKEDNNCTLLDGRGFVECRSFVQATSAPMFTGRNIVHHRQPYLDCSRDSERVTLPSDLKALSASPQLRAVQRLLVILLADYWLVKYAAHHEATRQSGTTVDANRLCAHEKPDITGHQRSGGDCRNAVPGDNLSPTKCSLKPEAVSSAINYASQPCRVSAEEIDDTMEVVFDENMKGAFYIFRGRQSRLDPLSTKKASPPRAAVITEPNEEAAGDHSIASTSPSAASSTSTWSTCSWTPCSSPYGIRQSVKATSRDREKQPHQRLTFLNQRKLQSACTRCATTVKRDREEHRVRSTTRLEAFRQSSINPTIALGSKRRVSTTREGRRLPPQPTNDASGDQLLDSYHIVYRQYHEDYVRAVASDRAAGGPFEAFLVKRNCSEAKRILNFWSDAQIWLTTRSTRDTNVRSYINARRACALMVRYLTSCGDRRMCLLAPALRRSLQHNLACNQGEVQVKNAQAIAIEHLRKWWDAFRQHDIASFQHVLVTGAGNLDKQATCLGTTSKSISKLSTALIKLPRGGDTVNEIDDLTQSLYASKRRVEIALQLTIETTNFCLDSLPHGCCEGESIKCDIGYGDDPDYVSLTVKPLTITHRPDLLMENLKRKLLAADGATRTQSAKRCTAKDGKVKERQERSSLVEPQRTPMDVGTNKPSSDNGAPVLTSGKSYEKSDRDLSTQHKLTEKQNFTTTEKIQQTKNTATTKDQVKEADQSKTAKTQATDKTDGDGTLKDVDGQSKTKTHTTDKTDGDGTLKDADGQSKTKTHTTDKTGGDGTLKDVDGQSKTKTHTTDKTGGDGTLKDVDGQSNKVMKTQTRDKTNGDGKLIDVDGQSKTTKKLTKDKTDGDGKLKDAHEQSKTTKIHKTQMAEKTDGFEKLKDVDGQSKRSKTQMMKVTDGVREPKDTDDQAKKMKQQTAKKSNGVGEVAELNNSDCKYNSMDTQDDVVEFNDAGMQSEMTTTQSMMTKADELCYDAREFEKQGETRRADGLCSDNNIAVKNKLAEKGGNRMEDSKYSINSRKKNTERKRSAGASDKELENDVNENSFYSNELMCKLYVDANAVCDEQCQEANLNELAVCEESLESAVNMTKAKKGKTPIEDRVEGCADNDNGGRGFSASQLKTAKRGRKKEGEPEQSTGEDPNNNNYYCYQDSNNSNVGNPTAGRNPNCIESDITTVSCHQLEDSSRTSVLGSDNGHKKDRAKAGFSSTVGARASSNESPYVGCNKSSLFPVAARQMSSNISKKSPTTDQQMGSSKSDRSPDTGHPLDCEPSNMCSVTGRNLGSNNSNLSPTSNCNASYAAGSSNYRPDYCNLFPSISSRTRCRQLKSRRNAESMCTWAKCLKTKQLWMNFIRSINSLRRGLINAESNEAFLSWVEETVAKDLKAAESGGDEAFFQVIGGIKVDLRKAVNDIRFMTEAESYRGAIDEATCKFIANTFKPQDDHDLQMKARAIAHQFFASSNWPDTPVNVSCDIAWHVIEQSNCGLVRADLLHYPTMVLYPVVDFWWRRFQESLNETHRDATSSSRIGKEKQIDKHKVSPTKTKSATVQDSRQKQFFKAEQYRLDDDRTHLLFNVLDGLRLIMPPPSETAKSVDPKPVPPRSEKFWSSSADVNCLMPGAYHVFYPGPLTLPASSANHAHHCTTCGAYGNHRNKLLCGENDPLAEFYDRLQARNHWKIYHERHNVLRHLPEQKELKPSTPPDVNIHSEGAPKASSPISKKEGRLPTPKSLKVKVPTVKESARAVLSAASYVVCRIDRLTYVLNPEAEIITSGSNKDRKKK